MILYKDINKQCIIQNLKFFEIIYHYKPPRIYKNLIKQPMEKTNDKELKKKTKKLIIENKQKKSKSQRMADKRIQKELHKLENSNKRYKNLNEQVEELSVDNITQIIRKRKRSKIENNQVNEKSERIKLISIDKGFDDLQKNLKNVRKIFQVMDSQFQSKLKHEQIKKQQVYKEWQIKKSNKWNELLKKKIVQEYEGQSQFQKEWLIKLKQKKRLIRSSNIQQDSEEQHLNKLKSIKDKIERWTSQQLNLIIKIQWLMLNFYMTTKYKNIESYKQILISSSSTILNVFQQKRTHRDTESREEYVKELKYNLYRVGINYLNYLNNENCREKYKLWTYFKKYFQSVLNTNEINFLAFRLDDQSLDLQIRYMFLEASFYNFIRKGKINNLDQEKDYEQNIQNNIKNLTQLSIKKSHIYYYEEDIKKLEKLVDVVKNSWYIRYQLVYYIRERKQYLKNNKQEDEKQGKKNKKKSKRIQQYEQQEQEQTYEQTLEKVKKFINKAQVTFIDYSMTSVNGITLTSSQDFKQYPIFINLFSLFQKNVTDFGYFESYTLFVLIHELANLVIRKCEFFKKRDSSNHQNIDEKMDGGWLFQYLVFGKANQVFHSKDYQSVLGLLKLKQSPKYLTLDPKNKKQYEEFTNNNQKMYQAKQKNLRQSQNLKRNYKFKNNPHIAQQIRLQLQRLQQNVKKYKINKKQVQPINKQEKNREPEIEKQQIPDKKQVLKMIQTISIFGKRKPNENQINQQGYMKLKTGIDNQLGHQFMVFDSHCGTHYK